jgi:uncharacterized membrane protein YphA (DoxX/SURF4 family)
MRGPHLSFVMDPMSIGLLLIRAVIGLTLMAHGVQNLPGLDPRLRQIDAAPFTAHPAGKAGA